MTAGRPAPWPRARLVLAALAWGAAAAAAAPDPSPLLAFVTNGGTDEVSVVDLRGERRLGGITVGRDPTGIRRRPGSDELYVVNSGSNTVTVLDARTRLRVADVPVGERPYEVEFAPDGSAAYVPGYAAGSLTVIDCPRRRVRATVPVGGRPSFARCTPDGRTVCLTSGDEGTLVFVETAAGASEVTSRVSVGPDAHALALTADGARAFVGHEHGVAVVDVRARRVVAQVATPDRANDVAVDERGARLFVSHFASGTVSVVDLGRGVVRETLRTGGRPNRIVRVDDAFVLGDFASDRVLLLGRPGARLPAVRVGDGPDALVAAPAGRLIALLARAGALAVVDVRRRALVAVVPAGPAPRDVALFGDVLVGENR